MKDAVVSLFSIGGHCRSPRVIFWATIEPVFCCREGINGGMPVGRRFHPRRPVRMGGDPSCQDCRMDIGGETV